MINYQPSMVLTILQLSGSHIWFKKNDSRHKRMKQKKRDIYIQCPLYCKKPDYFSRLPSFSKDSSVFFIISLKIPEYQLFIDFPFRLSSG